MTRTRTNWFYLVHGDGIGLAYFLRLPIFTTFFATVFFFCAAAAGFFLVAGFFFLAAAVVTFFTPAFLAPSLAVDVALAFFFAGVAFFFAGVAFFFAGG